MEETKLIAEQTTWPEALRMLRRRHCMTQAEAARHAGLAPSTWKSYEISRHRPQERSAGLIAKAFDIRPEDLPLPAREN